MRLRLNGWQRIGIVLSILWIVGVLIYTWDSYRDMTARHDKLHYSCLFSLDTKVTKETCDEVYDVSQMVTASVSQEKLLRGLAPIPIAWLLVYIVVWTVRWIRRGFQPAA
jgi:hypothetical protein